MPCSGLNRATRVDAVAPCDSRSIAARPSRSTPVWFVTRPTCRPFSAAKPSRSSTSMPVSTPASPDPRPAERTAGGADAARCVRAPGRAAGVTLPLPSGWTRVGQQDHGRLARRVDPQRRAGEAGVAEAAPAGTARRGCRSTASARPSRRSASRGRRSASGTACGVVSRLHRQAARGRACRRRRRRRAASGRRRPGRRPWRTARRGPATPPSRAARGSWTSPISHLPSRFSVGATRSLQLLAGLEARVVRPSGVNRFFAANSSSGFPLERSPPARRGRCN